MNEPVVRPGIRVVAEIPPGAKTFPTMYEGMPAWIVARSDFAPYYLLADGTRIEIETGPAP